MKKLTTVQVTPITQKGAVITPIQCEVKCGAAPHEVIRMVRSQVGGRAFQGHAVHQLRCPYH